MVVSGNELTQDDSLTWMWQWTDGKKGLNVVFWTQFEAIQIGQISKTPSLDTRTERHSIRLHTLQSTRFINTCSSVCFSFIDSMFDLTRCVAFAVAATAGILLQNIFNVPHFCERLFLFSYASTYALHLYLVWFYFLFHSHIVRFVCDSGWWKSVIKHYKWNLTLNMRMLSVFEFIVYKYRLMTILSMLMFVLYLLFFLRL